MASGYPVVALVLDYTYMCVCLFVSITPQVCLFTGGCFGTAMGISTQTLTQPFL